MLRSDDYKTQYLVVLQDICRGKSGIYPQVPASGPASRNGNIIEIIPGGIAPNNTVQVRNHGSNFAVAPVLLGPRREAGSLTQERTFDPVDPQLTHSRATNFFLWGRLILVWRSARPTERYTPRVGRHFPSET